MGEDGFTPRLGNVNMKALLGILAGAGASYGLYKLLRGRGGAEIKKVNLRNSNMVVQPGSLMSKVSGFHVVSKTDGGLTTEIKPGEVLSKSPGSLEPKHLSMLLSLLQSSPNPAERREVLITLGNSAAFTVNQDLLREFGGLHIIAGFLSDPSPDVREQTLNALSNLSMNIRNQEQLKIYVPSVVQLIEMSPVNSDLQLAALRLLTNLTVTDNHQHLMKSSITLLLSLLVVSNEVLQVQVLKVLVNLSSNPDMMDDIVQAQRKTLDMLKMLDHILEKNKNQFVRFLQRIEPEIAHIQMFIAKAPASLVLLFDCCTNTDVLLRLLFFVGNLRAWRPSAQVAEALRRRQDSLYCVLLDSSSQFHNRLPLILSHPDEEIKAQVARLLT